MINQVYSSRHVLIVSVLALLSICLSGEVFADDANQWHKYYYLGKFTGSNPLKPDQIFIVQYRVINGTVDEFKGGHYDHGLTAEIHSPGNSSLEIKFPRNYPFTNEITSPPNGHAPPIVVIGGKEVQSVKITDCFFVYPVSLSGNSTITFLFTILASESSFPYHGDNIPESCGTQTIAEQLPPLKQINAGVELKDIKCDNGFGTILHPDKKTISCVKPETSKILVERGWAKPS